MNVKHPTIGALEGGPLDGTTALCPLIDGFLPDGFEPYRHPEGQYVLARTVTHGDGSLCGGVYRWEVTR